MPIIGLIYIGWETSEKLVGFPRVLFLSTHSLKHTEENYQEKVNFGKLNNLTVHG